MPTEEDVRETDPNTFAELSKHFGPFDLDAACTLENAKCAEALTPYGHWFKSAVTQEWERQGFLDAFQTDWSGKVWLNPPYSELHKWISRCWTQLEHCDSITVIVPNNRCEQPWWQELVEPFRDNGGSLRTHHLPKRRKFLANGKPILNKEGKVGSARFGLIVLQFENP